MNLTTNLDIRQHVSLSDMFFYRTKWWKSMRLFHTRDDKQVGLEGNLIRFSSDNGATFSTGFDISTLMASGYLVDKIRILPNGNIVVFSHTTFIFYSEDNCDSFAPCILLNKDGSPWSYHIPVNPLYPGSYWQTMNGICDFLDGVVVGNYCNSGGYGATPVQIWHSLDGITFKVIYRFGQHPEWTDLGLPEGGEGGQPLGDPVNPLITRHIHGINLGYNGKLYTCGGDGTLCMHVLECSYDIETDIWDIADLVDEGPNMSDQLYRIIGIYERNGYLYIGSDGNTEVQFGIWKVPIEDFNDRSKWVRIADVNWCCYTFLNHENYVFSGSQIGGYVLFSRDYGETWENFPWPSTFTPAVEDTYFNWKHNYFVSLFWEVSGFVK